ncbi:hypothetical protein ABE437_14435 [Isoptericola cucumis]|uniref:sunset domain-containing protein n=1 Tax=Isoptericola cucumis TaxID=1776856 RepID=UPI00320B18ED
MTEATPARRAGRLVALATAATLLAGPLAVVPAAASAPAATAAVATAAKTSLVVKRIPTKTAPYKKKVVVRPLVTAQGRVSVKSKTLTVRHGSKRIATGVRKIGLKAGTYRVATNVRYRTYTIKPSGAKAWSTVKTKSKVQKLVVRQGKKPSSTAPVSTYHCPKWAPVKGNQSGIYHVPGGRYYKKTTPERCFTTASAARKAGYRASRNG